MEGSGSSTSKRSQVMDQRGGNTHETRQLSHSICSADRHPPAYTPNHEAPKETVSLGTCCALRRSNFHIPDEGSEPFLQSCQRFAFISWVLTERRPAETILHLERLLCPLLWCRKAFDNHENLVDHVMACPYIYDGEYWCPYCQKRERFAEAPVPEVAIHSDKNPRKRFFKGAVNALRKLSKKARSRKLQGGDRDHKYDAAVGNEINEIEIDGNEIAVIAKHLPELSAQNLGAMQSGTFESSIKQCSFENNKFYCTEMDAAGLPAELACNHRMEGSRQMEHKDQVYNDNVPCPDLVRDFSQSTEASTPDSIQTPISPLSPVDRSQIRPFDHLDSPISPTDTMPWSIDASPLLKSPSTFHEQQSRWPFTAPKLPEINIDTDFANFAAFIQRSPTVNSSTASTTTIGMVTNATNGHDLGTLSYVEHTSHDIGGVAHQGETTDDANHPSDEDWVAHQGETTDDANHPSDEYWVAHQGENTDDANHSSDEYGQNSVLRKYITEPLFTCMGLEGFWTMVNDFDRQLNGAWLVSVRELQLELVKGALACAKSEHLCVAFVETVMDLCNTASASLGVGFTAHDQECLDEIDILLREYRSSHVDSDDESQEVDFTTHSSSEIPTPFELPGSAGSLRTSEAPWMPTSFDFSVDTSPRPVSPLDDLYFGPVDRNETISPYNPELPELDTAGPNNPPIPERPHGENTAFTPRMSQTAVPEATMQCDECPTILKGKARWLPSNMQRHKREKHSKLPQPKIACSEAGCTRTFSRRHNLVVHLRSVHNRG